MTAVDPIAGVCSGAPVTLRNGGPTIQRDPTVARHERACEYGHPRERHRPDVRHAHIGDWSNDRGNREHEEAERGHARDD